MIRRNLYDKLSDELGQSRAVALLGARQVGKSTLCSEVAKGLGMRYVSLDDEDVLAVAQNDPVGFIARIDAPSVIDEVQRAPGILLSIKQRLDSDNTRGQFLLTGSADLLTLRSVADTLPGRVIYLELHPFSQGELRSVRETFISRLFSNSPPDVAVAKPGHQSYAELLVKGGYPEAQERRLGSEPEFFSSYITSLLDREIAAVFDARSPQDLVKVFRLSAARSGSIANYNSISRDIGISDKTVRSYIESLEKLFVLRSLEPWYRNLGHRVIKTPKIYVNDTGLLCAFTGADVDGLSGDVVDGMYFETFVVSELIKQRSWDSKPLSIYYYRDHRGREIDIVLERHDGSLVAIEVKTSATIKTADFASLRYFREKTADKFKCGIVLYSGRATQSFDDRLHAVPLEGLWS